MAGAGWLHIFNYQSHATGGMETGCRVQGTDTECTVHSSTELETSISPSDCCSHQPPAGLLTGHRGKLDLENEACWLRRAGRGEGRSRGGTSA